MGAHTDSEIDALFVYGTLRPGQSNWPQIAALTLDTQTAIMRGFEMYHLPEGYPAVIGGVGEVRGTLVWPEDGARDELLQTTDRIERFAPGDETSLYRRVVAGVGHARAFIYLFHPSRIDHLKRHGTRVPHGNWPAFREERT